METRKCDHKKVCRHTNRSRSFVMAFLAAARDLPQDAIPATKSWFGRPPNTLMIYCSENYARTITLVHQNSRRCIRIISGMSLSDVSSTACRRAWTYQDDVLSPNLSWLYIWGIDVSNLLWDIFTGVLMTGKRSCRLMNLPFSACPATNKGHLSANIDPWILPISSSQHAPKTSKCDQSQRLYYQVVYCCIIVLYDLLHCSMFFYTDFRINVVKDRGSGYFLRP